MIPEDKRKNQAFMEAWVIVWPVLKEGLVKRIISDGAGANTAPDKAQPELASQRILCQLCQELNEVGTIKAQAPRVGPQPLKPTY